MTDLFQLRKLLDFINDEAFIHSVAKAKQVRVRIRLFHVYRFDSFLLQPIWQSHLMISHSCAFRRTNRSLQPTYRRNTRSKSTQSPSLMSRSRGSTSTRDNFSTVCTSSPSITVRTRTHDIAVCLFVCFIWIPISSSIS